MLSDKKVLIWLVKYIETFFSPHYAFPCTDHEVNNAGQVIEDLRERFFGPSFELMSDDKVSVLLKTKFYLPVRM